MSNVRHNVRFNNRVKHYEMVINNPSNNKPKNYQFTGAAITVLLLRHLVTIDTYIQALIHSILKLNIF